MAGSPPSDSSASTRSDSSTGALSSSSSLASTFSDLSQHRAKTHAFFASPFSTDPDPEHAVDPPQNTTTPTPARSITADFFSTPVRTPSPPPPPPHTHTAKTLLSAIHPSRIFPSRYTSRNPRDDDDDDGFVTRNPKPDRLFFDISHAEEHASPSLSDSSRLISDGNLSLMPSHHSRDLSSLSSISTSSSFASTHSSLALPDPSTNPHRLPTPPPRSPHLSHGRSLPDEPTPRPSHLEPNYAKADTTEEDDIVQELTPGCIITSVPPSISHPGPQSTPISSPALTVTPPFDSVSFSAAATSLTSPPLDPVDNNSILHLIRPLGQGAFSSVWLAEDKSRLPLASRSRKNVRDLRRKASLANLSRTSSLRGGIATSGSTVSLSRRSSLEERMVSALERDSSLRMRRFKGKLRGTRPVGFNTRYLDERHGEMGINEFGANLTSSSHEHPPVATGPPASGLNEGEGVRRKSSKRGRLVAVKMTPRRMIGSKATKREREEEEERTRVGFVREVEVLKHISHPNITPLFEHLSTSSHHILVLPYLSGGDLLGLVNNDIAWSKLGENVLRRIWCELCKAVGWMHGVGLVHRDIKLENILLTTPAFSSLTPDSARPTLETLPTPPLPLIKLTDFGLSRFIEIDENGEGELLWTRCGSEAYAAPELVMGSGSVRAQAARKRRGGGDLTAGAQREGGDVDREMSSSRGFYDARETDAWACGVVLYALVARKLPFGEGVGQYQEESRIGGDGADGGAGGGQYGKGQLAERRQWLMRIARGEYEWPQIEGNQKNNGWGEFVGQRLVNIEDVKRIVGRLLVRDPRKRARIMDLWDEEWMWGRGGGLGMGMTEAEWREWEREKERERERVVGAVGLGIDFGDGRGDGVCAQPEEISIDVDFVDEGATCDDEGLGEEAVEEVDEVVDGEEGWLLDQEGIGSIARQEVV